MSEKPYSDSSTVTKAVTATGDSTAVTSAAALFGADLVVVALAWDNPPI